MDMTYYPCAAVSCCSWLALYKYVSPAASEYFFPKYKALPRAKQIEWDSRFNSSIHSAVVSLLCLYALLYDTEISVDPIWGDSHIVKNTCAMVVGYMICDCLIVLQHYKEMGELFYLMHHAASVYAFWFVITYGCLTWFANFRLLAEFSTPFVNQRWFLDVLDYPKSSSVFLMNGVAMAAMFFFVRIGTIPPYWHKVYIIYGTEPCVRLGNIWWVLISSCVVLDFINLYWMYKIFKGAQKVLKVTLDKNRNIAMKQMDKQS